MTDSTRETVLTMALEVVTKDRNTSYGTPEQNFGQVAELWAAYKEVPFSPHDVAVMQILLKVARTKASPTKLDHWIDIAGYSACGAEVRPLSEKL